MDQGTFLNRITEDGAQRSAFYNALFLLLLGLMLGAIYTVYQMLHLFVSPVLLGALFGTILFPVKRSMSSLFKEWLNKLDKEDRPLMVGILLLPIQFLNRTSRSIFSKIYSKQGIIYIGAYIILKVLGYNGVLVSVLSFLGRIYAVADRILAFFTQIWIFPLISLYTVAYISWLFIQKEEELKEKKKFARSLSLPIWFTILAFVSSYCGVFHVLVFTSSAVLLGLIASGIINLNNSNGEDESTEVSAESPSKKDPLRSEKKQNLEQAITSDRILRAIFALFGLVCISKHDTILVILLVFFLIGLALNIADRIELWEKTSEFVKNTFIVNDNASKLVNIIVPGFLRQFLWIVFNSDRYLIGGLKNKVDLIASISVMVSLSFGTLLLLIFAVFQLQAEVIHIGSLVSNVVSSNPEWLNNVRNYTGEKLNEDAMNNYAEQAYIQSREWVGYNIRSLASPGDKNRADQLEQQAKILVDNLYKLYEERMKSLPDDSSAVANRGDWLAQLLSTSNVESLKTEIMLVIKENIDTILSIAQSLWKVVAVNISIISTVATSILGLLLGFGFDLLNFFIEIVVFLMVAYYLLINSEHQFLPLKWISDIAPSIQPVHSNIQISTAIENSVTSVFILTAKMSLYYFLHTYIVHSLFCLNIVFIPSIFAGILAPIPLLPPYSVAVFGVVELWLVKGQILATIVFVIASISPIFFADAAFYSEIKYSHPYLIGLAIVGGIYSFGIEGALIGPIVLCCLVILINVYADYARNR